VPLTWAVAYCEEDGNTYRVNGQHTTKLLSSYPFDKIAHLYVHVHRFTCKTLNDVAALNGCYDAPMSAKTANDTYKSFAASEQRLDAVSDTLINNAAAALAMAILNDVASKDTTAEQRAKLVLENVDFTLWFPQFLCNKADYKLMRRSAVIAAMYDTYMASVEKATVFWSLLRSGNEPASSPVGRLREFLMTYKCGSRQAERQATATTPAIMRDICVDLWGKWLDGITFHKLINPKTYETARIKRVNKAKKAKKSPGTEPAREAA
jgi:hypothetical protein